MTHRQKVDRLIEESRKRSVGSHTTAPPLFRFLWAVGIEIPPPFFLRFVPLALLMGITFGVFLMTIGGALSWLVFWQDQPFGVVVLRSVLTSVIAGTLYGLWGAWFYRRKAEKLGLPSSWKNYATP